MDLNGDWDIHIGFDDLSGDADFVRRNANWRTATVPGCWERNEEDKQSDGPVWYRKRFSVPEEWSGRAAVIDFEGVNYYCEIYLNGSPVSSHEGGWSGFQVRAETYLQFRSDNELLVLVYKQGRRFPPRECLAGFLPDVGVMFGGIWKPVTLRLLPVVSVTEIHVRPRVHEKGVFVDFHLLDNTVIGRDPVAVDFEIRRPGKTVLSKLTYTSDRMIGNAANPENGHSVWIPVDGQLELWSPDNPVLYELKMRIAKDGEAKPICRTVRFGFKDLEMAGDRICLNGTPLYIRGVLHWGWYGDHIAPNPAKEEIRIELQRIKESGFNTVKLCLYVPVKEFLDLADEMGILIWQELPMWLPEVTPEFKRRVFSQYGEMIKEIRNHPSVVLWTLGCELDDAVDSAFLQELYETAKRLTDRAIIRDNSGSGECYGGLLREYADFYDYHFYTDIHFFPDLLNQFAGSWREPKPWLFGEFCDYDEFRDLEATIAANGGDRPWWLRQDPEQNPISKDSRMQYHSQDAKLAQLHLPFDNEYLIHNARQSAYAYRKSVVELVRTYRNITGYVLTSIKDTPIATSAIFDDRGIPKQPPDKIRQWNDEIVIALTWDNRTEWIHGGNRLVRFDPFNACSGESFRPHLFVSCYSPDSVRNGKLHWEIRQKDGNQVLFGGEISGIRLEPGDSKEIGMIEVSAPIVERSSMFTLQIVLNAEDRKISNEWSFCVYPPPGLDEEMQPSVLLHDPMGVFHGMEKLYPSIRKISGTDNGKKKAKVIVTSWLQEDHYAYMKLGGNVLYVQRKEGYFPTKPMPFWRESLQLFHDHPVMNAYPHNNHTGMTMFGIATDYAFHRSVLPEHHPVLERLDARKFDLDSYMFEQRVGRGKLVATTLRFEGGLGSQPDGFFRNTSGRYLFDVIVKYLLEN